MRLSQNNLGTIHSSTYHSPAFDSAAGQGVQTHQTHPIPVEKILGKLSYYWAPLLCFCLKQAAD